MCSCRQTLSFSLSHADRLSLSLSHANRLSLSLSFSCRQTLSLSLSHADSLSLSLKINRTCSLTRYISSQTVPVNVHVTEITKDTKTNPDKRSRKELFHCHYSHVLRVAIETPQLHHQCIHTARGCCADELADWWWWRKLIDSCRPV